LVTISVYSALAVGEVLNGRFHDQLIPIIRLARASFTVARTGFISVARPFTCLVQINEGLILVAVFLPTGGNQ